MMAPMTMVISSTRPELTIYQKILHSARQYKSIDLISCSFLRWYGICSMSFIGVSDSTNVRQKDQDTW